MPAERRRGHMSERNALMEATLLGDWMQVMAVGLVAQSRLTTLTDVTHRFWRLKRKYIGNAV
jgi:hypothetical protein